MAEGHWRQKPGGYWTAPLSGARVGYVRREGNCWRWEIFAGLSSYLAGGTALTLSGAQQEAMSYAKRTLAAREADIGQAERVLGTWPKGAGV